ncbi:aminoglycoside phosphotransferase family protein [Agromyces sp. G08B096]|uniref:Aminoglycoside phosphotransferase family protein n=1 Tax=Agromyces sp. G08B096 TaxID=3156399 RepID=A0AAU7W6L2_9MICO
MTDAPAPDVEVDEALVARLVREQHPDLAGDVRLVANGWDNAIFRLGERWAVRMPRRELGARLVAGEQLWLPELARMLPVAVPAPVRAGVPAAGYPYAWSIVPWFDGVDAASVTPAERTGAAADLAATVSALAVPAPREAPFNPYRGIPLAERDAGMRERFASPALAAAVAGTDVARLEHVWHVALAAPAYAGPPVWVHGDLHPANLLLRPDGALAAVLDFGDVTAGDPATDLATAWLTFDAAGRDVFRRELDAAGVTDASAWARARGWALVLATGIVTSVGVEGRLGTMALHALGQVLSDPAD